jgi:hypothetical protein
MADTTIYLEIVQSNTVPAPDAGDTIPWCIALATRANSPANRNGHRLKKKGYYYRYTGGNTEWDDGTPIKDGDFEFDVSAPKDTDKDKTVEILFHTNTKDWGFVEVKELDPEGPLTHTNEGDKDKVTITDDTSNTTQTSGNFGCVVKKGNVEIYCDPNWDNV